MLQTISKQLSKQVAAKQAEVIKNSKKKKAGLGASGSFATLEGVKRQPSKQSASQKRKKSGAMGKDATLLPKTKIKPKASGAEKGTSRQTSSVGLKRASTRQMDASGAGSTALRSSLRNSSDQRMPMAARRLE